MDGLDEFDLLEAEGAELGALAELLRGGDFEGMGDDFLKVLHPETPELSPVNCQLSSMKNQLSTINYQPSTINYQLSTINLKS